jgi:hypothetical protein
MTASGAGGHELKTAVHSDRRPPEQGEDKLDTATPTNGSPRIRVVTAIVDVDGAT